MLHGGRVSRLVELLATDEAALRAIGLSRAEAVYLHSLAACLVDGWLDLERRRAPNDDAGPRRVTQAKSVGRFTADGVLMLSLRRRAVWPAGDLALRRGVARVDRPPPTRRADAVGGRFRP